MENKNTNINYEQLQYDIENLIDDVYADTCWKVLPLGDEYENYLETNTYTELSKLYNKAKTHINPSS